VLGENKLTDHKQARRGCTHKFLGASLFTLALLNTSPLMAQAAGAASDAAAEEAPQSGLSEIIVTARRKAESLQKTPVAVTAFDERALETRGIGDTAELANFTPNVTFDTTSTFSGASSTFQGFIRGIGQGDFAINTDPGVGLYIDDVYIARSVGSVFELYDIEQVEVIKGPQGTLFGRNSIGGAVNITTAKPNGTFSFKGAIEYGRFDYVAVNAAANLPITDGLYASVAVSTKAQDGYQTRIPFTGLGAENVIPLGNRATTGKNGGDAGALDNQSIRGKLLWEASDRLETTFSVDYSRIRDAAPPGSLIATAPPGAPVDGAGVVLGSLPFLYNQCVADASFAPFCGLVGVNFAGVNGDADPTNDVPLYGTQFLTGDPDTSFSTGANYSNIDSFGVSNVTIFELSDYINVKSILAYRTLNANFGRDIDGSPLDIDQTTFRIDQSQFSAELQLNGSLLDDRLDFTFGGYYFTEDATQDDAVPLGGGLLVIGGGNTQETKALAAFGEVNFKVTDRFSIFAGGRYTDEKKTLLLNQQNLTNFFGIVFGGITDAEGDTPFPRFPNVNFLGPDGAQIANFNDFSFRVGANYEITPDIFAFASFSQGFKSGGFTTRLTAPFNPNFNPSAAQTAAGVPPGVAGITFNPETSDNFEIGLKADLFNNTLRTNFAAFWNKYNDIQIVVQRGITPANENAGNARIRGIEIESEFYPTDNFSLVGSFGYIDAEYTSIDPFAAPITINSMLQDTPEFTFAVGANYVQPIGSEYDLTFNANYSWRSSVANDAQNTPELIQSSYGLLGGQIKFAPVDGNWALSLIGKNITNERVIGGGFNSGSVSFIEASFNRPSEWRIKLDVNF
jgi:iron complex outermembrane receptor protein